ncbi:hypothetical protein D3C87_1069460 [compost metagenome]
MPAMVPAHVRRAGRIMLWGGFAFPVFVYVLIVVLVPLDVLDQQAGLKNFTEVVRLWLLSVSPSIDIFAHAQSTTFPQVAKLGAALGMCVTLLIAFAILVQTTLFYGALRDAHAHRPLRSPATRLAHVLVLPVVGLSCLWIFFCLKGDPSYAPGASTQSRWGYIVLSALSIAMAGGGVGLWVMQIRFFIFDVFFRRSV